MPNGYGSRSVCLSVCYHIFGDIVHLYVTMIAIRFTRYAPDFYKRDFCEKALFTSYGIIYLMRPTLLL